jgi:hypothetical protein
MPVRTSSSRGSGEASDLGGSRLAREGGFADDNVRALIEGNVAAEDTGGGRGGLEGVYRSVRAHTARGDDREEPDVGATVHEDVARGEQRAEEVDVGVGVSVAVEEETERGSQIGLDA